MICKNWKHVFTLTLSVILTLPFSVRALHAQDETPVCVDCAELGRKAAALQLKALEAARLVEQAPSMLQEADRLDQQAFSEYGAADIALEHGRKYGNLARDMTELAERSGQPRDYQDAAGYAKSQDAAMAEFHEQEARGKTDQEKAQNVRDKANSAKADAGKAEEEAKNAWQAYSDCLKKARCPGAASASVTTDGIADCKQAQDLLDRANELHRMSDRSRGLAKESANDKKTADYYESEARMLDGWAREREQEAAFALSKCPPKVPGAPDVPANAFGNTVPPGALPLPQNSEVKTTITIKNDCKKAESYRFETKGFPDGMIQADDPMRVDSESSREFTLTYNAKGRASGLYRGTFAFVCTTCDASCPRTRRDFPMQLFVPEQ